MSNKIVTIRSTKLKLTKKSDIRRLEDILISMYKVQHSLAPQHICSMFYNQDKHYNLRSDFSIPRYGTVKYDKHSIKYIGPCLWGKISQEVRSKTSFGAFVGTVRNLDMSSLLDGACSCCACT